MKINGNADRLVGGLLLTVLLGLSAWTLTEVVDLGKNQAALSAKFEALKESVGELKAKAFAPAPRPSSVREADERVGPTRVGG